MGCSAAPTLGRCQFSISIISAASDPFSRKELDIKQTLMLSVILWKIELSCFSPVFFQYTCQLMDHSYLLGHDLRNINFKSCFFFFFCHDNLSSCLSHLRYFLLPRLIESLLCARHCCLHLIFYLSFTMTP